MQQPLGPEQQAQVDALRSANSNDKGLIDLKSYENDSFSIFGYSLTNIFDDILLAQYVDLSDDGEAINRNGVLIPINQVQKAWRIGQVLSAGPNCQQVKVGDYICFPNDKGIPVSNLDLDGFGTVKNGIFLNEQRIFGICKKNTSDDNRSNNASKPSTGKRSGSKVRSKKS
tara:strand:+ start:405 stop:917 length:513 start_codon:yes stop_codon:yes gene_type:complete